MISIKTFDPLNGPIGIRQFDTLRMQPAISFAQGILFNFAMPWMVRVRNDDGSVADVLTQNWATARSMVDAYRSSNREAWITDARGEAVDEEAVDRSLSLD